MYNFKLFSNHFQSPFCKTKLLIFCFTEHLFLSTLKSAGYFKQLTVTKKSLARRKSSEILFESQNEEIW